MTIKLSGKLHDIDLKENKLDNAQYQLEKAIDRKYYPLTTIQTILTVLKDLREKGYSYTFSTETKDFFEKLHFTIKTESINFCITF